MCGIGAILDRSGQSTCPQPSNTQTRLDKCNSLQRHRGPDSAGTWISADGHVGLAHARLATRDLSAAGHQPLHSTNAVDDIHVVVNGELYYPEELRNDLSCEYTFSSSSDSEMAIALYRRHGVGFVEHLRGEFSIVLYDGATRTLIITRDRFGIKPLHYGVFGNRLLVATQCKGIAGLLNEDEHLQWDPVCFAQGGGHYGHRTLFEGIRKVPAGHIAVIREQDSMDELVFRPYWRTHFPANQGMTDDRSTEKLVGELRALLRESVEIRVKSTDVPIGLLLSGGVDSSAVAGMAAEICRGQREMPTCYTIAFPGDAELDESAIAARTASHLGLPLVKVQVTEQALVDEFEESCWLGEVPMWDLQHIAKKVLSRRIREDGLRVVLNGDGSDELFGGYIFFVGDRLLGDDQRRSAELQEASHDARERALRDFEQNVQFFGRVRELPERSHEHGNNSAIQKLGLPPSFCELPIFPHDSWLREDVKALSNPFEAISECFSPEETEDMQTYHPLHKSLLAWQKTLLPNLVIASISDGAEMAHSVESRPPFLDHKLAEFAHQLPVDTLVHLAEDGTPTEKWIFREAVKPYVTDEVYARRKHAFAAPFRWKMHGPLHMKLKSLLTEENVRRLGVAEWAVCSDMVDRAFVDQDDALAQIVSLGLQMGVGACGSEQSKKE